MDPVTLGIVVTLVLGIVLTLALVMMVRAWIRTLKLVIKLVFYGLVGSVLFAAVAAVVAWVLYGEQIQAMLAG